MQYVICRIALEVQVCDKEFMRYVDMLEQKGYITSTDVDDFILYKPLGLLCEDEWSYTYCLNPDVHLMQKPSHEGG